MRPSENFRPSENGQFAFMKEACGFQTAYYCFDTAWVLYRATAVG
ncbi:hypothetical protein [Neisseria weaveri]|nr:hypothetical protein [Neisseria weaveri]EGV35419.1 hypothetical protein l11_20760 [Neisseria weaveri LMG 5135]EGV35950.1 hypothetical protein l13_12910 [Neisseria weaveri ATCC 51223]